MDQLESNSLEADSAPVLQPSAQPAILSSDEGVVLDASSPSLQQIQDQALPVTRQKIGFNRLAFIITSSAIAVMLLIAGASYLLSHHGKASTSAATAQKAQNFKVGSLALNNVDQQTKASISDADHLSVNGQLKVASGLVLASTSAPTTPEAGEIYYDKTTSAPYYYNGSKFVSLAPAAIPLSVSSLGGAAGAVSLGDGLQINNNQLAISSTLLQTVAGLGGAPRVSSLQGKTGDVSLVGGTGIAVSGTTISNTGVTGLAGTAGQVLVSGANGNVTLSLPQSIGVASSPTFAGLQLGAALSAAYGGTGLALSTGSGLGNGVLITSVDGSSYEVAQPSSGGLCLISDASAGNKVKFGSCTGSTFSGVTDLNGIDGSTTLASADGTVIITNDVLNKKIDVKLPQDIASTASPTFVGVTASTFSGDGSAITGLNGSNISSGTVADARLSTFVTLAGNVFNGVNQLVKLDGSGALPAVSGTNLTNLNGTSITSGTVADARLSNLVTLAGNAFNGISQLVKLDAAGKLPALDGSALSNLNATSLTSGTVNDSRLSANVTTKGNTFNGASQLVLLNAATELPAVSGINLTNLNASNIASGSLNDARLSTNVTLQGNTFNGVNQLVKLDGSGDLPAVSGANLTSLNGTNISSGTVADARLSANVTLQGNTFNGASQLVKLDGSGALPSVSGANLSSLNANAITSGTVSDARLSTNVTVQGNTFNGASQLVKLDGTGALPAVSGTNVTNLNGTSITSGTVADARLTSNVTLQGNTFNGSGQLLQLDAGGAATAAGMCLLSTATGTAFAACPSASGSGVSSITAGDDAVPTPISGALTFVGAGGLTVTSSGTTITLTAPSGSGSGVTSTGSAGKIAKFGAGGTSILDSALSESGTTNKLLTYAGNILANTVSGFVGNILDLQVNGASKFRVDEAGNTTAAGGLTVGGAINAGSNTITSGAINGQTISTAASFTGTLAVQGSGGVSLGVAGTTAGSLTFNTTGTNPVTLVSAAQNNALSLSIPADTNTTDTICLLTLGNCVGTGAGVTASGITSGRLTKFTGTGNGITSSGLAESGTTLTYNGNGVINAASGFTGNLLDLQLNAASKLSVNQAGNTTVAGTLSVGSNATVTGTLGVSGTSVSVGGVATIGSVVLNAGNTKTATLSPLGTLAQNTTYTLPDPAAASDTICLQTLGNCGASSGNGNYIINSTSPQASSNFNISATGKAAIFNATSALQFNGTDINTAGTLSNVAYLNQANTFTAAGTALTVNNAAQIKGGLSLGVAGTTAGSLTFNTTGTNPVSISSAAQNNALALSIPADTNTTDTICLLTLGNCAGSGTGVTASGITTGRLTKFTGTGNGITSSGLAESSTTLTYNGNQIINAAGGFTGNLLDVQLNGASKLSVTETGNVSVAGTLGVTSGATIGGTLGVSGATVTIGAAATQGNLVLNAGNTKTGTLKTLNTLAQNTTYTLPDPTAASDTICLQTLGNCAGSGTGVTASGITAGSLTKFTGTGNGITSSGLSESSTTLTYSGNAIVNAASGFTGNLLDLKLNGTSKLSVTETGNTSVAGTLGVTGSATVGSTLAVSGATVTVGAAATQGNLVLNAGNTKTATVSPKATLAQNTTYTLPDPTAASDTICLQTLGNCAGSGTGVTASGITAGSLTKFTGTGNGITSSGLAESSTTLTYSGNAIVNAGSGFTGNLLDLKLNGASKLSVTEAGNTSVAGTLGVTGNTTVGGTLTVSGASATLGAAATQGNLVFNAGNTKTGTLKVLSTLGQNSTYTLPDPGAGGTDTICLVSLANCGASSGNGNYIINSTSPQASSNFNISATGKADTFNAVTAIQLNGANINTAGTLNNVAYLNQANTFTNSNIFKAGTNSTAAFSIQNSAGASVLNADTTNKYVGINNAAPNATLDVTASSAPFFDGFESGALSPFTSDSTDGNATLWSAVSNSAHTGSYTAQSTIGSGGVLDSNMYLTKTLTSAGTISFWWSCSGSFFTHLSFYIDGSLVTQLSSGGDCSSAPSSGNYSTGVASGTHTFRWDLGQNVGSSGGTARIDDVSVTNAGAGSAALFNGGNVGIGTSFPNATLDLVGTASFKSSANSTTAFQIQNAAGTGNNFVVDTTNGKIGIGQAPTTSGSTLQIAGGVQAITGSSPAYAAALAGTLTYDSGAGKFYVYDGSAKKELCNKVDLGCGSSATTTLAQAYANGTTSTDATITLDTTRTGVFIRDASTPIGSTLFAVQSTAGTTNYLSVTPAGVAVNNLTVAAAGSLTLTGGNTASRPASPTEGMLYYDSTIKQLLVYANGKWQADRTAATKIVGTSAAGGASTAVASQNADGADFVNASTTSAQTVINNAISALPSGGGTVYIMDGTYIIDGPILLPANVTLTGSGAGTIIKLKNAIGSSVDAINQTGTPSRSAINNLKLDGNKTNNSPSTQNGIAITGGSPSVKISNVWVENFRTNGIQFSGVNYGSITNSTVIGNGSTTADKGIFLTSNSVNNVLSGNTVQGNTGLGIHMNGGSNLNTVTGNTSQGNGAAGISTYAVGNSISGNTSSSNAGTGIDIGTAASQNTVTGNTVSSSGTDGIAISTTATDNIISNNRVATSGTVTATSDGIRVSNGSSNNTVSGNVISDTAGTGYAIEIGSTAASTYVSDNTYSGTGASSISDSSSTTIYGGQLNTLGDYVLQGSRTVINQDTELVGSINSGYGGIGQFGNLLTYSEQLDNAAWTKSSVAVTADNVAAPDGQTTAEFLNASAASTISQTSATATGGTYTFSVWLRSGAANRSGTLVINGSTSGSGTAKSITITPNWQRFFVTQDTSTFSGNVKAVITQASAADDIYAWGAQLISGSASGAYVRSTASTIATSTGVVSNGGLFVSSINASDKPLVVQGAPSQSGNLFEVQDSTGAMLANINSAGLGTFAGLTANGTVQLNTTGSATTSIGSASAGAVSLQSASTVNLTAATSIGLTVGTTSLSVGTTATTTTNLIVSAGNSLSLVGGNTASRPASPTEGMLYYDSTIKQLLVYANGKWQADRSTSTKIVATSATGGASSAVASQNPDSADFVNTSTSAAETTIQAAISALPATGGTVFLEEGTYIISSRINVPSNVTITGSGNNAILKIANSNNTTFDMIGASSGQVRTTIKNLKLDGNKANNTSGTQRGIMNNTGDHHIVDHIWATGFRNEGILMSTSQSAITNSTADNNTGYGFNIGGTSNTITGNIAESNTDCGFGLTASNTSFSGNTAYSNTNDGFCGGGGGNSYAGNISNNNSQRGFNITSNNLTITGNTAANNSNTGINTNGNNITISGNTVTGNGFIGINVAGNTLVTGNMIYDNGGSGSGDALGDNAIGGNNTSFIGNDIKDTAGTSYAISIGGGNTGMYVADNNIGIGSNGVWNSGGPINDNGTLTRYSNQAGNNNSIITTSSASTNVNLTTAGSGSFSVQGGYYGTQLPTPSAPSLAKTGASGTTWGYKITALDGTGETLASTEATISAAATLDASNYVTITWSRTPGATQYKIYRTTVGTSPSTTGLLSNGTVNASATTLSVVDNGVSASGTTPNANTTGGAFYSGSVLVKSAGNSTTAFRIQDAGAANTLFTANTTSNYLKVGDSDNTAAAKTTLLVLDTASTTNLPSCAAATVGGLVYDTTANALKVCNNGNTYTTFGAGVTDLQGAYSGSANSATTPEIKVDSTRAALDIQDADTTIGANAALLNIRSSATGALGTSVFSVTNTGNVSLSGALTGNGALTVKAADGSAAAGTALTLAGGAGNGTDKAGGDVTVSGGASTGTGNGGSINFSVTPAAGSSGASANSAVTSATISSAATGNIMANPSTPTLSTSTSGGSIAASTTYYYRVAAYNASGITTAIASSPASLTSGAGSTNSFTVNWTTAVTNASGYIVYRSTNGTAWTSYTINSGATTSLVDTGSIFTSTTPATPPTSNISRSSLALSGAGLSIAGVTGSTFAASNCTSGQVIAGNYIGGVLTDATCVSNANTLQQAYNASTSPELVVDSTRGAITVRDASTPIGANLLEVQSNNGGTSYLAVSATGTSITGTLSVSSTVNLASGDLQTAGTARLLNTGQLQNVFFGQASGSGGAGTLVTGSNGAISLAATASTGLCLLSNGSNSAPSFQSCPAGGSNTIVDGGNTLSQAVDIGTNDGQDVNFRVAGTNRLSFVNNTNQIFFTPWSNTGALQVRNGGNTTTVLDVDSSNNRVGINMVNPAYDLDVTGSINASTSIRVGGTQVCTVTGCLSTSSGLTLGGQTFGSTQSVGSTDGQQFNFITSNTTRFNLSASGQFTVQNTTGTNGFRVLNSGSNEVFSVDASSGRIGVGTGKTAPGYGVDVNGDINVNSGNVYRVNGQGGSTITCSSTQALNGVVVTGGIITGYNGCATNGADLAEAYNSTDALVPGELVMSSASAASSVNRATGTAGNRLMGIVSTDPGKTLGTDAVPNGFPIALSGRVPTKVNTEGGAIAIGDKITISSVAGVGKKATGKGIVVGTALEAYNGAGTGTIEVFVNTSYYDPTTGDAIQAGSAEFGDLNVSGNATFANLHVTGDVAIDGTLTVAAVQVGTLTVNGHIVTAGDAPLTSALTAAGQGASVTIDGNDTAGTITISTGSTGLTAGDLGKVTFKNAFGKAPKIVLSAQDDASINARIFPSSKTASDYTLKTSQTLAPNTTYTFDYFVVQ